MPVVSYNKGVPKFTSDLGRIKVSRLVFHNVELNTCEIILHSKYLDNQKSRFHFAFPVLHCVIFSHTPVLCLETLLKIDFATISYPSNIEPKTNSIPSGFFVNVIHSAWIFPTSRPVRLNHTCANFLLFQIKLRYSQQKYGSHVHSFGKILLPTHFRGFPRISARLLFS